jgi:ribosomal protein S18 acetylase RimI-like enzyme
MSRQAGMEINILEADDGTIHVAGKGAASFEVRSKLILHAENGRIGYTIVDVPPYTKQYDREEFDLESYIRNPDKVIFLANVEGEPAGQVRLRTIWNGYAYIDLIVVEPDYRNTGVGQALMERAVQWAKDKCFPGIMLETQDINVPACKFYESCGFVLRGFDTHLYKAQDPATEEIALYWYLNF